MSAMLVKVIYSVGSIVILGAANFFGNASQSIVWLKCIYNFLPPWGWAFSALTILIVASIEYFGKELGEIRDQLSNSKEADLVIKFANLNDSIARLEAELLERATDEIEIDRDLKVFEIFEVRPWPNE